MLAAITVQDVLLLLQTLAPPELAEDGDNIGLLIGGGRTAVSRVMTALDLTPEVVKQAADFEAQLVVCHHPPIYRPVFRLDGDGVPWLLANRGIAAIAMHTNLDKAPGGVNDMLASRLGLRDATVAPDGICRIGRLEAPLSPRDFAAYTAKRLETEGYAVQWAAGCRDVQTVGVCGGAGHDFLSGMLPLVDAYVTGELSYHDWPAEPAATIVAAGHYHTEIAIARELARVLEQAFPDIQVQAAAEHCPYRSLCGE